MPGLNYVPSNRVLRAAWTAVALVCLLVFAGLTYTSITTAFELRQTNERLDQSQADRQRLLEQMREQGVLLSFIDGAPDGVREATFRCKSQANNAYICRPEQR